MSLYSAASWLRWDVVLIQDTTVRMCSMLPHSFADEGEEEEEEEEEILYEGGLI